MTINGTLQISRSGLKSLQTNLDNTANNIANVNTTGYQAQTTHFQGLIDNALGAEEALFTGNINDYQTSAGSAATTTTSFAQGNLTSSAQPLDVAIQGSGFFGVQADGQLLLTRAGSFHLSDTKQLVNSQGYPVAMTTTVANGQWPSADQIQISTNGQLTTEQNGQTVVLGQLTLYQPQNTDALQPMGDQLYQATGQTLMTSQTTPDIFGTINQFQLEDANVDLAGSMTELLMTQRAYALNTKAMQTTDDMWAVVNRFTD